MDFSKLKHFCPHKARPASASKASNAPTRHTRQSQDNTQTGTDKTHSTHTHTHNQTNAKARRVDASLGEPRGQRRDASTRRAWRAQGASLRSERWRSRESSSQGSRRRAAKCLNQWRLKWLQWAHNSTALPEDEWQGRSGHQREPKTGGLI